MQEYTTTILHTTICDHLQLTLNLPKMLAHNNSEYSLLVLSYLSTLSFYTSAIIRSYLPMQEKQTTPTTTHFFCTWGFSPHHTII